MARIHAPGIPIPVSHDGSVAEVYSQTPEAQRDTYASIGTPVQTAPAWPPVLMDPRITRRPKAQEPATRGTIPIAGFWQCTEAGPQRCQQATLTLHSNNLADPNTPAYVVLHGQLGAGWVAFKKSIESVPLRQALLRLVQQVHAQGLQAANLPWLDALLQIPSPDRLDLLRPGEVYEFTTRQAFAGALAMGNDVSISPPADTFGDFAVRIERTDANVRVTVVPTCSPQAEALTWAFMPWDVPGVAAMLRGEAPYGSTGRLVCRQTVVPSTLANAMPYVAHDGPPRAAAPLTVVAMHVDDAPEAQDTWVGMHVDAGYPLAPGQADSRHPARAAAQLLQIRRGQWQALAEAYGVQLPALSGPQVPGAMHVDVTWTLTPSNLLAMQSASAADVESVVAGLQLSRKEASSTQAAWGSLATLLADAEAAKRAAWERYPETSWRMPGVAEDVAAVCKGIDYTTRQAQARVLQAWLQHPYALAVTTTFLLRHHRLQPACLRLQAQAYQEADGLLRDISALGSTPQALQDAAETFERALAVLAGDDMARLQEAEAWEARAAAWRLGLLHVGREQARVSLDGIDDGSTTERLAHWQDSWLDGADADAAAQSLRSLLHDACGRATALHAWVRRGEPHADLAQQRWSALQRAVQGLQSTVGELPVWLRNRRVQQAWRAVQRVLAAHPEMTCTPTLRAVPPPPTPPAQYTVAALHAWSGLKAAL